jgi:hypothetical protein
LQLHLRDIFAFEGVLLFLTLQSSLDLSVESHRQTLQLLLEDIVLLLDEFILLQQRFGILPHPVLRDLYAVGRDIDGFVGGERLFGHELL